MSYEIRNNYNNYLQKKFLMNFCRGQISDQFFHESKLMDLNKNMQDITTNKFLGIFYMSLAMFFFVVVDTQAKYLTQSFHPFQIVWFRQLGLLLVCLSLIIFKGPTILRTKRLDLQLLRGFIAATSPIFFIFAISYVPLADAIAVSFVAPFFVTIMGAFFLGEKIGIKRSSALCIGFLGALIITRPGLGVVHPAVLLAVVAAVLYAGRQVLSRFLSQSDNTFTTICYSGLVGSTFLTIFIPFFWRWPENHLQIGILICMMILAASSEIFIIKSLEVAEAVVLAPVHYTLLIWGTIYGYFIFGDLPDFWTWLGVSIIIVSGLYSINSERKNTRQEP